MNDKPIPKYQIRKKTPNDEVDITSDKKLTKKLKKERIKLDREKVEWEKTIKKFENYNENIEDLEKKKERKRDRS